MSETLDDLYLTWLYSQVGSVRVRNPAKTHWTLLKQLYTKEFIWFIPNDDNRAEDGRELRHEFIAAEGLTDVDPAWMELGCSMLEMLIALSRRAYFEDGHSVRDWFWILLRNLGLDTCTDKSRYERREVDEVLETVIHRRYDRNGNGGLFPLYNPAKDQRRVEIWYQLCEYLLQQM